MSCGSRHSSWFGNAGGCTAAPPRWPVLDADTCEHVRGEQVAAESVCAFLDLLSVLQTPFLEKLLAPSQFAAPGEPAAGPEEGEKEIHGYKSTFENNSFGK